QSRATTAPLALPVSLPIFAPRDSSETLALLLSRGLLCRPGRSCYGAPAGLPGDAAAAPAARCGNTRGGAREAGGDREEPWGAWIDRNHTRLNDSPGRTARS